MSEAHPPIDERDMPPERSWGGIDLRLLLASLLAVVPLWVVARPASQDWPQHVAAVRVLVDHAQPELLARAVELDLARTQYIGFYLVAALFALVLGAQVAVKLAMSLVLISIPYALRSLLRAVGSDTRYALFALALTYNAHLVLGFLSFVAAIPVALVSLSLAVAQRARPSLARGALLSLSLVALFYLHVLPFALALLGVALALAPTSLRALGRALPALALPLVLPLGLATYWSLSSTAGGYTRDVLWNTLRHESEGPTRFEPFVRALVGIPGWLTDVLPWHLDMGLLGASTLTVLVGALGFRERNRVPREPAQRSVGWLLAPFALACAFVLPTQHAWIWPIAGRFPYLALLLMPLALPRMRVRAGEVCAWLLAGLGVAHAALVGYAFVRFESQEVAGFDEVLARVPEGASVLGLIYASDSRYVLKNPLMHFHAYAQAEKGAVVRFSFAETPQSPFVYRPYPDGPPPVNTGMGWTPQAANLGIAALYFDYVLTRGGHAHLAYVEIFYELVQQSGRWALFRRKKETVSPSPFLP